MKSLKSQFLLDPKVIFLNHGSFGATPRSVFNSYQRWQRKLELQPVEFLGRKASGYLASARQLLAEYIGTQSQNLVFVTNATVGINTVARSLMLGPDDEVLASNHEYGALDRTWTFLAEKQGFKYINHPIPLPVTSKEAFVERFWQAVTPRTRVIFLSHITSPTALVFPVEDICRKARQCNICTVIDGAHAPGQITLNLEKLDCDFYSGNLHKWLCAPKGAAFLYAHPRVQNLVQPLTVSWGWRSENPSGSQFIDYLEWQGTRDLSAFLSVPDAILFQNNHSWPQVRSECHKNLLELTYQINKLTGLESISPQTGEWFMQMASCLLPSSINTNRLKTGLYDHYHIEVPILRWEDKALIRISYQAYNSQKDSRELLRALRDLLK